jgi:hypothetical protein
LVDNAVESAHVTILSLWLGWGRLVFLQNIGNARWHRLAEDASSS